MMRALVSVLVVLAACGQERIEVREDESSDYNHSELRGAVDKFVTAGRTPEAYAELAHDVLALRPGMDRTVGEEAELKMLVLALGPIQSVAAKPIAEQVELLALTVWPTLLAAPIAADGIFVKRDEKAADLIPKPGETARTYLMRLCGGPLSGDCKQVVPEYQGEVIFALATRRATERARNALTNCLTCSKEPGWAEAVRTWESLDRTATGTIHELERRAAPDNWPIAGNSAEDAASLPDATAIWREAELNTLGEIVIGGQSYAANTRVEALRELRGDSASITFHIRPDTTLAQVKALLADAKRAGAGKVAIVARAPQYPWERRIYWLSEAGRTRAGLRPTDSLQLLLHTIDHIAGPGAVARVD